jgi:sarcosine oxidase subunit gamma
MSVLETFSNVPMASPLKTGAGVGESALTLSEITVRGVLHLRGSDTETALQESGMKIGEVKETQLALVARLRHDEFVLMTRDRHGSMRGLRTVIGDRHITLTDITHGRCGLLLAGEAAAGVLRKVCGLDFGDAAFPNLYAAQTSLAKVRTLIIRADIHDIPAYGLFVDRSLARYVWDVVYDAAQEFGVSGADLETKTRGLW